MNAITQMDEVWKEREQRILVAYMERFFERWKPEDDRRAAEFHAEFVQVVQALHRDSHATYMETIKDLMNRIPRPFIFEKPQSEKTLGERCR